MPNIPERLREATFRFVLLKPKSKVPFERGWNNGTNYAYSDPRLVAHLDEGGNYGVLCGINNLVVVDADHPFVKDAVNRKCPDTFDVTTGRLGTHYYFFTDKPMETIKLRDPDDPDPTHDIGHIKGVGSQVVGPDSEHENGTWYSVCHDLPIAAITTEFLREALSEFILDDSVAKGFAVAERREAISNIGRDTNNLRVESLVDLAKFRKVKDGYIGPHPVHGSTGGQNFHINTTDNYWYCFRCNTGGGAVSLVAILEGLVKCDQAKAGTIRGELFKQTMEVGEKKYGFPKREPPKSLDIPHVRGRPQSDAVSQREPDDEATYDDKRKAYEIAAAIMDKERFIATDEGDTLYHYQDGYYSQRAETFVSDKVVEMSPEKSSHFAEQVVYQIKANSRVNIEELNADPYLICVNNGILNVITRELTAHDPDKYITVKLNINYDPTATCPTFLKFLNEVVRPEDVANVQEMFGYCLLRKYLVEKAFMLVGPGGNGKGVLIHTLENLLGRENIASVSLQEIGENRFAAAELYMKLANTYADLSPRAMSDMGLFKMLTGRDVIKAERKHCDPFHFRNYSKLIFSTNRVPYMKDSSDAVFQRWLIIDFPFTFRDTPKCDPELELKLSTAEEKSGMLTWALEGLKRLMETKRFSNTNTTDEMRVRYQKLASPIAAFVEDNLESDAGGWMAVDDMYDRYLQYTTKTKLPKTTKPVFVRDLPMHMPGIQIEVHGKTKGWRGAKAKTEAEVPVVEGNLKTWMEASEDDDDG